jgi:endonuclease/exonuclease/phosphatase family metal-dependent hydrolase
MGRRHAAPHDLAASTDVSLRVVSYNIHKGIGGVDRRYDLGRIVDVLQSYAPDVALLQEVDDGVARSRHDRQVERLAEATQLTHFAYQRNVSVKSGHYGNAILSRFPLHDVDHVDLTIPLKKRRQALVARCRMSLGDATRSVELVNVHLGLAGFERTMQLRRLLAAAPLNRVRRSTPLVLGGDFNDVWGTLARRIMGPAGFEQAGGRHRTFPAAAPVRGLDRLFFRGDVRLQHVFVGHTAVARRASDHLPLVVDLLVSPAAHAGGSEDS